MHERFFLLLSLIVLVVLLASCGAYAKSAPIQLSFEAPMNVDSSQRFHVSLGVRNLGEARFREHATFNGTMELHDASGEEVGRVQVATLWELAPGNAAWPAAYASKLPAGAYQLTWGAPEYGSVTVDFTIVDLDGWLYLGEESIQSTAGDARDDQREHGSLQSLANLARVNLGQRLAVEPEAVTVQGIEEVEFPDASLGLPEPDRFYAQVITPGYVIKLAVDGQTYEYRVSQERLAFAPQGSITIENVQVIPGEQIFVYGQSTLPEGTCLGSELWAGGELQAWWPGETCVPVEGGAWQMVVRLGRGEVPSTLDPSLRHMLRVFQQNGPDIVGVFAFDPPDSSTGLPNLTVDEQAIVAAEVDGPGHVEYTERLGADILARIEGLRATAAEQELANANAALAPFGYRLEARFDAEWDRTFYDLYRQSDPEPMLARLSQVWPVSVNASGTKFVFAAENAPNVAPLYLQVQASGYEGWEEAEQGNWLPPAYVDDTLARVTFTGFPTLTYQVELDDGSPTADALAVYSGTAVAMGAYIPLRSFTTWDGHWVLEVDDHLIVDGQDLGQSLGYEAAFGFHLIQGQPFYFFQQDGQVRISFGGKTLPNVYNQVFHNQCCEAAMHNVLALGDAVLFHALSNGTWYFVEAGVYDGEMAGTYRCTAPEGWSFRYPMHWDRLDKELGFVQDTTTGKTVTFASMATTQAKMERWLDSEIGRKLAAIEAKNTIAEPLTTIEEGALTIYRYAILSRMDGSETLLRTTVFFDGQRRYEFYAAIPPLSEDEYQAVIGSFMPVPAGSGEGR